MVDKNKGNAILILLFVVVAVGLGILLIAKRQVAMNYTNNSYQVTTDTSNPALDKDLNAVDQSINGAGSDVTNVSQGINETPLAQPSL